MLSKFTLKFICSCWSIVSTKLLCWWHGLRTPREQIAFIARPKIQSQSQIFRYGGSIFCLPHRPNFSDIFDLCLHWVSVVRGWWYEQVEQLGTNLKSKNKHWNNIYPWIYWSFVKIGASKFAVCPIEVCCTG